MRRLLVLMVLSGGCIDDLPPRVCSTDDDCVRAGAPGRCLAAPASSSRWCAFTASECSPSQYRWGALAGDGLAEMCVEGQSPPDARVFDAALVDAPGVPPDDAPIPVDAASFDATAFDAPIVDAPVSTPDALVQYDARPAALSSQPSSVSFGSVTSGMTKTSDVEIHNDGGLPTGSLTVGISGLDASRFTVLNDMCVGRIVPAGGMCTLSVRFAPTSGGGRSAQLNVGDGAASVMVGLSGTGVIVGTPSIEVSPGSLTVTEGQSSSFNVNLSAQPTTSQTVMIMSTNASSVTVGTTMLTFSTVNWAQAQAVTVNAVEDVNLANDVVTINLSNATMPTQTVTVTATDNDTQRVVASKSSVTIKESGAGNSTTVGVSLAFMPASDVTVNVMSENGNVATASPGTLTFRPENYSSAQNITITGVPDVDLVNATTNVTLTATNAMGATVGVTTEDVDTLGIVVNTSSLGITEGQTGAINVKLSNQPTATTVLDVTSDKPLVATVDKPQLTFTTSNWNMEQTVTVTGANDGNAVDDTATITVSRTGLVSRTVAVTVDDINCASDCDCGAGKYCGASSLCATTLVAQKTFLPAVTLMPTDPQPWVRSPNGSTTFTLPTSRDVEIRYSYCAHDLSDFTDLGADARVVVDEVEKFSVPATNNGGNRMVSGIASLAAGLRVINVEWRLVRFNGPPGPNMVIYGYNRCQDPESTITLTAEVVRSSSCP